MLKSVLTVEAKRWKSILSDVTLLNVVLCRQGA
jgi:hypothetical protein